MSIRYLDLSGAVNFWTNIKNYILSKIPTKTSELTNDSGYITNTDTCLHKSGDESASGDKNFKGLITTIPDSTLWAINTRTTADITFLGNSVVHVEQRGSGNLTDLSGGAWNIANLGIGCFFFRINNGTDIRYKNFAQNTVNRIYVVSNGNRQLNNVTPETDNTYSLGDSTRRWKECYSNAYYLGTTAFGDIVTHNASEFLTTSGNETVTGTKIFNGDKIVITQGNGYRMVCNSDGGSSGYGIFQRVDGSGWYLMVTAQNDALGTWTTARPATMSLSTGVLSINGNAGTATQFSANTTVALTGDATGTSAGSKKGWSVPVTLANSGVTAGSYGPSEDASPAHSGTFTVPSITVDAKGRITAASTKTITLPSDNNTDTKVTQTVTTGNSAYPVLLCATANATATGTTTSRFSAGLTVNTRYSSIYMTNKYDTTNTRGVRNTSNYSNGVLYFRSYDETQMGVIRCESNKGGYQQIYMMSYNYIKNGTIDPEGTYTTCYITVRVRDNGSKTIYTDGSWENSLTPDANNTHSLGTASLRWKALYATTVYEGGTALSDKYLTVSAISGGASTSAGNITPVKGTIISGFADSDQVTYSTNFGGVLVTPSCLYYATCIYNTSNSTMEYAKGPSVGGTGTWKLMGGGVSNPGTNTKLLFGLWIKIV